MDVEIVLRETMHGVKVPVSLAGTPVTAVPFPTLSSGNGQCIPTKDTSHGASSSIRSANQLLLLNDVIYDEVVPGLSEGWQTAMEPVEDGRAHALSGRGRPPGGCRPHDAICHTRTRNAAGADATASPRAGGWIAHVVRLSPDTSALPDSRTSMVPTAVLRSAQHPKGYKPGA